MNIAPFGVVTTPRGNSAASVWLGSADGISAGGISQFTKEERGAGMKLFGTTPTKTAWKCRGCGMSEITDGRPPAWAIPSVEDDWDPYHRIWAEEIDEKTQADFGSWRFCGYISKSTQFVPVAVCSVQATS